jgi:LmbE family N-acetylglucosaminyl deacetylase
MKLFDYKYPSSNGEYMKTLSISILLFLLAIPSLGQGTNGKRVALVIGAQNYTNLPPLRNSLNDAKSIGLALKEKGFQVETVLDPKTKRDIKDAINRYFLLMREEVGAVGIIFYAGHGMQFEGDNYIIPIAASLQNPGDLEDYCVKMNTVMSVLKTSTKSLNILLLDACRTLPSFTRASEQGLTRMDAPQGAIIVFATQPGKVASDGTGTNGLFTSKFLNAMDEPNLNIYEVFKRVKQEVYSESKETQLPSVEDNSMGGDFFFTPLKTENKIVQLNQAVVTETKSIPKTNTINSVAQFFSKGKDLFDDKHYTEAFSWFGKGAEQGDSKSQNNLGIMYEFGYGVQKDKQEAVKWYTKAASQGNIFAQYNLGVMYETGTGVTKDETEASKWYRKAAEQGNVLAQNNLANMYESGRGVPKDLIEATKWREFLIKKKQGSQLALSRQSEIRLKLKKLNTLGAVLYVGAHPDDENTSAIAYFTNEKLFSTAYLSITRGEGGQNLIGNDASDLLGVIRTQETLASRGVDGAHQFFTRANDFGFSKSANETLITWDKQIILSDVVRVIRQFQPDVIITRFPADERAGHGHHIASASLTQEAFDLASDPGIFPDQLQLLDIWQPKRLYLNTGRFFNQSISESTPNVVNINMFEYNPVIAKSYSELAAISRHMQRSQGFGSPARRSESLEFFEYLKGEKAEKDLFEGINTTWSRLKGGETIAPLVEVAITDFNEENPGAIIPQLISIRKAIRALEESIWKQRKLMELDIIIQDCLGLTVDAVTNTFYAAFPQKINVSFEIINRSPVDIVLTKISSVQLKMDSTLNKELKLNKPVLLKTNKTVSNTLTFSSPYWLKEEHTQGHYIVEDPKLIGSPQDFAPISFNFSINVLGETIIINDQLDSKIKDAVIGESSRLVEITPPVFVNIKEDTYLFTDQASKEVKVQLKSAIGSAINGVVELKVPPGWRVEPTSVPFNLVSYKVDQEVSFQVYPIGIEQEAVLRAIVKVNGQEYDLSVKEIIYDHIPVQTLMLKAKAKIVRLNLQKEGKLVAYIKSGDDNFGNALVKMGYEVWNMKEEEVTPDNLKKVDAVVLGVRLLNTSKQVKSYMPILLEYVNNGGTMVTQYNSSLELGLDNFSPYPITLSRDRVTEEGSEVRILRPNHSLLNHPNKIAIKDFQGWIQERGLFLPSKWDEKYEALISMNDANESPKDGGLLVTKYGKGYYIYTSLAFFRELPGGVSGAYKLFANLISAGK